MTDRHYEDEEIREIFNLATRGDPRDQSLPLESDGLTLEELQRIGAEAGIEPARVAEAAKALAARAKAPPVRRSFGMPVGVSRVVDLPRAPSDREWEQMISIFRSTFGAQGQAVTSGGLRDWSIGSLHVSVEPTERGEQLRLSTVKEDAVVLNGLGVTMTVMSVIMSAVVIAAGKPEKALALWGMFGGMALASFGANVLRLPRWAREREAQMESIAAQAVKMLSKPVA